MFYLINAAKSLQPLRLCGGENFFTGEKRENEFARRFVFYLINAAKSLQTLQLCGGNFFCRGEKRKRVCAEVCFT